MSRRINNEALIAHFEDAISNNKSAKLDAIYREMDKANGFVDVEYASDRYKSLDDELWSDDDEDEDEEW